MCETNAYVYDEQGREILYLESVDLIKSENGMLFLQNLFGEQKLYDGYIQEVSLAKNKILLSS